ncbi:CatB-related O-acetyltransferase [Halosimplex salinum]|uniref:CatB-related O-acetyltransferase n=1 Tax=Halosimplex salinum TaxID=1710538 RepID=UPI0013DE4E40|nr:CatB-related O-acetyltransferase [Halosimplex salinum]
MGDDALLRGDVTVGRRSNLVENNDLVGEISIGNFCAIAPDVRCQAKDHVTNKAGLQTDFYRDLLDAELGYTADGPIRIGNDVWIGARSIVLSGVTIGDGAIVAGGSVVTNDVEPYSLVAGVPAEHKRWRFPERIREELLDIEWWTWSDERIRANEEFFVSELDDRESVRELIVE